MTDSDMERTIEELRNNQTGEKFTATEWLSSHSEDETFALRHLLKKEHLEAVVSFVCAACDQPVHLAGTKEQRWFFKHYADSADCKIKTSGKYSQEDIARLKFNGQQESDTHRNLKRLIYQFVSSDSRCSNCIEDTIRRSIVDDSRWRKPDVGCELNGKKLVFEIQLSTTFLDVMLGREQFYKDNQTYIIWVFHTFNELRRFVEKDAYYLHRGNLFVLDSEAIQRSSAEKKLILHCYTKLDDAGAIEWRDYFFELSQLRYEKNYEAYYKDMSVEQLRADFHRSWLRDPPDTLAGLDTYEYYNKRFQERFAKLGIVVNINYKAARILNALYSIRDKAVYGFKYPTFQCALLQISHLIYEKSKESLYLYLRALVAYDLVESIKYLDKEGKFQRKMTEYKGNRSDPRFKRGQALEEFLCFLFPEIVLNPSKRSCDEL